MKKNKTQIIEKAMKKKPTKKAKSAKLVLPLPSALPIKPKKKSSNTKTKLYYQCMNACCQGQNITKVAQQCKTNAPALLAQRTKERSQEITKIKNSWKQIGLSLSKLIEN